MRGPDMTEPDGRRGLRRRQDEQRSAAEDDPRGAADGPGIARGDTPAMLTSDDEQRLGSIADNLENVSAHDLWPEVDRDIRYLRQLQASARTAALDAAEGEGRR